MEILAFQAKSGSLPIEISVFFTVLYRGRLLIIGKVLLSSQASIPGNYVCSDGKTRGPEMKMFLDRSMAGNLCTKPRGSIIIWDQDYSTYI